MTIISNENYSPKGDVNEELENWKECKRRNKIAIIDKKIFALSNGDVNDLADKCYRCGGEHNHEKCKVKTVSIIMSLICKDKKNKNYGKLLFLVQKRGKQMKNGGGLYSWIGGKLESWTLNNNNNDEPAIMALMREIFEEASFNILFLKYENLFEKIKMVKSDNSKHQTYFMCFDMDNILNYNFGPQKKFNYEVDTDDDTLNKGYKWMTCVDIINLKNEFWKPSFDSVLTLLENFKTMKYADSNNTNDVYDLILRKTKKLNIFYPSFRKLNLTSCRKCSSCYHSSKYCNIKFVSFIICNYDHEGYLKFLLEKRESVINKETTYGMIEGYSPSFEPSFMTLSRTFCCKTGVNILKKDYLEMIKNIKILNYREVNLGKTDTVSYYLTLSELYMDAEDFKIKKNYVFDKYKNSNLTEFTWIGRSELNDLRIDKKTSVEINKLIY